MSTTYDPYDVTPVIQAEESARVTFMRQIGIYTFGSLLITGVAAVMMMGAIATIPEVLGQQYVMLGIMLGGIYGAQFVGNSMTLSENAGTRIAGYVIAPALAGIALAYLLTAAVLVGASQGDPLAIVGQAGLLTGLTVVGMVVYLLSGPRNLNFLGAGLSMLTFPMLGLMVLTWGFGSFLSDTFAIAISVVFVGVSGAGLLYSLNQVLHEYSTSMVLAGATRVSIGIVVLFWNILSLLLRLTSRD